MDDALMQSKTLKYLYLADLEEVYEFAVILYML